MTSYLVTIYSSCSSLNLSQNVHEGWTNSYWKRQVLIFYPPEKKTGKKVVALLEACNVRSETSVTVPSRLNAPVVLWRWNNLTLSARVGLKLSTWRLESVAGLLSTRLATAVTFVGDLGPSKWEFCRCEWWKMCVIYQDTCFWRNCLHIANVTEFVAAKSGAGQERFANLLFSSLYCHLGEKLSLQKRP